MIDAPAILSAFAGAGIGSVDPGTRLATIDPAWNGTGNPRVTFDSEVALSTKGYVYIGSQPAPGDRVILRQMGDSWVITGPLGGATRKISILTKTITVPTPIPTLTATAIVTLSSLVIPDPGYPYLLGAMCDAYYECEATTPQSQWDTFVTVATTGGLSISKEGIGAANSYRHVHCAPIIGATKYTGSQTVFHVIQRITGTGKLVAIASGTYGGMTIFVVPA